MSISVETIFSCIVSTESFVVFMPQSPSRELFFRADGSISDSLGEVLSWSVVQLSSQRCVLHLRDSGGILLGILQLNSKGVWVGTDRRYRGQLELRPHPNFVRQWVDIANGRSCKTNTPVLSDGVENTTSSISPSFDIRDACSLSSDELTTAVCITACDRPKYFKQVVDSLALNELAHSLPLFVFLDRPTDSSRDYTTVEQRDYVLQVFPRAVVVIRPDNFGCGRNLIDARRQLFDVLGFQKVFMLEDDLVLASTYLEFCLDLLSWAGASFGNVGAVQGWADCKMAYSHKAASSRYVMPVWADLWGYLMTRDCWDQIKSVLYDYEKLFLGGVYSERSHKDIQTWLRGKLAIVPREYADDYKITPHFSNVRRNFFEYPLTGQDGVTVAAMQSIALVRLAPLVNRARYIGEVGIHSTKARYKLRGLDEVRLDYVDSSRVRQFFPLVASNPPSVRA